MEPRDRKGPLALRELEFRAVLVLPELMVQQDPLDQLELLVPVFRVPPVSQDPQAPRGQPVRLEFKVLQGQLVL